MINYTQIGLFAAFVFFVYLLLKNKQVKKNFTKSDFVQAFKKLYHTGNWPDWYFPILEQQYRNETAHFSSGQYRLTGSPGMEAHANKYPYGWGYLYRSYWNKNPQYAPIGVVNLIEGGTGKTKPFLIFDTVEAAIRNVFKYYDYYGNPYRWYSIDKARQAVYKSRLNSITPSIYYSLTA